MAIKPISKPGKSASFYRKNKASRDKKKRYDTKFQSSEKQKAKKRLLGKKRYHLKKKGVNIKGKDLAHTTGGIVLKDMSKNRGSTGDAPGDKRARGGKKNKKNK